MHSIAESIGDIIFGLSTEATAHLEKFRFPSGFERADTRSDTVIYSPAGHSSNDQARKIEERFRLAPLPAMTTHDLAGCEHKRQRERDVSASALQLLRYLILYFRQVKFQTLGLLAIFVLFIKEKEKRMTQITIGV